MAEPVDDARTTAVDPGAANLPGMGSNMGDSAGAPLLQPAIARRGLLVPMGGAQTRDTGQHVSASRRQSQNRALIRTENLS